MEINGVEYYFNKSLSYKDLQQLFSIVKIFWPDMVWEIENNLCNIFLYSNKDQKLSWYNNGLTQNNRHEMIYLWYDQNHFMLVIDDYQSIANKICEKFISYLQL